MSIGAWWYTIVNLIKNLVIRTRADRVIRTFWETPNAQDAIRFMESRSRTSPSRRSRSTAPRPPPTTSAMKARAWSRP
jgi:hypothetical protein